MTTKTYTVSGMTCGHCVNSVTTEISKLTGVRGVSIDLGSGAVTVDSEQALDDAVIASAVGEAGYRVVATV